MSETFDVIPVVITAAICGMIGSGAVLISSRFIPPDRRTPFSTLVCWLAFADLMLAIAWVLLFDNEVICYAQAIGLETFEISSFLWSSCIAYSCWKNRQNFDEWDINYPIFCGICFGIPVGTTILDLSLQLYGRTKGGWCWILERPAYVPYRFLYYGICLFSLVFILIVYISLAIFVSRVINQEDTSLSMRRSLLILRRKFFLFVIAYFISQVPSAINRIQDAVNPGHPWIPLYYIQAATQPSGGLWNALVYGELVLQKSHFSMGFYWMRRNSAAKSASHNYSRLGQL